VCPCFYSNRTCPERMQADFDTKQVLMSLMIAIMGLVTSYNSQESTSIFDLWFSGKK